MNVIDLKLIDAYTVLVLAKIKTIKEVPEKYRTQVEIKEAEKIIEILEGDK